MHENDKQHLRELLSSFAGGVEFACRFALLFFMVSLVVVPLFFPAEDEAHAVVGFILQAQGAVVCFLGALVFRAIKQFTVGACTARNLLQTFSLIFFLAFLSEVALTLAFQKITGAIVTSVSLVGLVGLFEALPSYTQWYECLSVNGTAKLLTLRLDASSLAIASILGGISICLKQQDA